jgi:hypothetical protein
MKGIRSQLGNFSFGTAEQFEGLTIPDESNIRNQKQEEKVELTSQELRIKRDEIQRLKEEQNSINSKEIQNKFELLIGLVRTITEVEIEGTVFYLKSLKKKETLQLESLKNEYKDVGVQNMLTIALALFDIKVNDISVIKENESLNDKLNYLLELDDAVYQLIFMKYHKMLAKHYSDMSILGNTSDEVFENIKK